MDTLSPVDPTGSPVPGVYTSTQQVTLTADGATTIHYNIGTAPIAPTCSTGAVYTPGESDPISVTASNPVIKAIACYSGDQTSEVATLTYTIINVQQPTSNPVSGSTFITSANIVLSHNSSATSIHYVMNNSTPTCSNIETLYTNPIVLLATATIKAVSCYPGNHTSDVATFTFTQNSQNNNENNGGGGVVSVGGGGGGPSGPNTPTPTQTTGNTTSGNGGGQHVGDCTSGITNSVGQDEPFSDEIGHWSHDCVLQLYKAGVVTGRAPHLYVPEGNLTRAEAVKIGLLAFGYKLDTTSPSGFTDLDPNAWYVPYLRKAKQQGFISGTQFHPNDAITRADALVLFLRIAKKLDTTSPAAPFTDVSQSASYAQYVNYAYAKNIVKGRTPTTFVPNGTITRAEIAKIVALIEAL